MTGRHVPATVPEADRRAGATDKLMRAATGGRESVRYPGEQPCVDSRQRYRSAGRLIAYHLRLSRRIIPRPALRTRFGVYRASFIPRLAHSAIRVALIGTGSPV
jgi:hypothetical protein